MILSGATSEEHKQKQTVGPSQKMTVEQAAFVAAATKNRSYRR